MTEEEQTLEQRVRKIMAEILAEIRPLPAPMVSRSPGSVTEVIVGADREVRVRVTSGGAAQAQLAETSGGPEPDDTSTFCPDPISGELLMLVKPCLSEEDRQLFEFIAEARSLPVAELLCVLLAGLLTDEALEYAREQGIELPAEDQAP